MARIVSIPPTQVTQGGGLSNSLVAGLVGDRVVDPFAVSDNNSITGQFLRDLIGPAFDNHRNLTTMTAVAASSTAVEAIRIDATANNIALGSNFSVGAYLNRIRIIGGAATDSTLAAQNTMTAVAASSTARSAIRVSTTAITAINASQLALDAMYAAATKFTNTHGGWSAMPATLVGTGNYLIVRLTQVQTGFTIGSTLGQYLRRGDASTWTMTDGDSTANIPTRSAGTRRDNALRTVNNMSIQYYLWEAFEIAYLTA